MYRKYTLFLRTSNFGAEAERSYFCFRFEAENVLKTFFFIWKIYQLFNSAEQKEAGGASVEMFYIVYISCNKNVKVFLLGIELIVLLDRSFQFPFILTAHLTSS